MAGIGFELKKLFADDGTATGDIKATIFSTIIGIGPWLITIVSLNILNFIAKIYIPLRSDRNIFITAIIYTFIFSQIFMGPFQYLITRFISDKIYSDQKKEISGAFIGGIKIIFMITFIAGYIYIKNSPLPSSFKYVEIVLFSLTAMTWLTMIFIGVLKNYKFVVASYLIGNVIAATLGVAFFKFEIFKGLLFYLPFPLLLAYTIGMLTTFFLISSYLMSILKNENSSEFAFLNYYRGYLSLGIMGTLFVIGNWAHIGINWLTGNTYLVGGTFLASPFYEIIAFYASILVIPTMVYFFVFLETNFFNYYKDYYRDLNTYGNNEEIESKRKKMIDVLKEEILYCMELQFFISLSFAFVSNIVFENFGLDMYYVDLFRIMVFGTYCTVFTSIYLVLLLYFDARKESLILSIVFSILNIVLSYAFNKLGPVYSGVGYFLANFISLILANFILDTVLKKLNFQTFYRQNFKVVIGNALLNKIEIFFNKKGYIVIMLIIVLLISFN